MEWKDSRLESPSPNSFRKYIAAFRTLDIIIVGYADWHPTNQYTAGEWKQCYTTTGNPIDGAEVLYWMPWPVKPKILEVCEEKR